MVIMEDVTVGKTVRDVGKETMICCFLQCMGNETANVGKYLKEK